MPHLATDAPRPVEIRGADVRATAVGTFITVLASDTVEVPRTPIESCECAGELRT